jgi:hypothetical protein
LNDNKSKINKDKILLKKKWIIYSF